jgi:NAD(P)-dependent dehydrogenase (short-subunit alcohol dehydrogenase family)
MKKKKIALVTGANKGLGFETCLQLAQLGLTVILSARDLIKGQLAAKQLADRGLDVLFYQLDVSNQSNITKIAHRIEQQFGRLDILINNAAILYDTWQKAVDADLDVVNQAFTTNLFGAWRLSQVCITYNEEKQIRSHCKCVQWSRLSTLHGCWNTAGI